MLKKITIFVIMAFVIMLGACYAAEPSFDFVKGTVGQASIKNLHEKDIKSLFGKPEKEMGEKVAKSGPYPIEIGKVLHYKTKGLRFTFKYGTDNIEKIEIFFGKHKGLTPYNGSITPYGFSGATSMGQVESAISKYMTAKPQMLMDAAKYFIYAKINGVRHTFHFDVNSKKLMMDVISFD